jgi:hypothetical protein
LTYTPLAGGPQLLFLASSQNWIRTLDAKTGALINARQVHTPFLQSDIGCTDIPGTIGIIGTPVIDPNTDTAYFFAKTYISNYRYSGDTGTFNGVYYFHGVNVNTLEDRWPPVLVDGSVADNDPRKYFIGGIVLQRPVNMFRRTASWNRRTDLESSLFSSEGMWCTALSAATATCSTTPES